MFGDRFFGKRYFANRYFGPGASAPAPTPTTQQPGGGYYRPIKYVRDGKIVDLHEKPRPEEPELEQEQLLELSDRILSALGQGPQPRFDDLIAEYKDALNAMWEHQLAQLREDEAEEDTAILLLLS